MKTRNRTFLTLAVVAITGLFLLSAASIAQAAVISVDADYPGHGTMAGDNLPDTFTTTTTTPWNSLPIPYSSGTNGPLTLGSLTTMDSTPCGNVTFTLAGGGEQYKTYYPVGTDPLYGDNLYGGNILPISFSGLVAGGFYNVKFYTGANSTDVTLGGATTTIGYQTVGTFNGVQADTFGVIAGSFVGTSGPSGNGNMSGIQIQGVFVPEPATLSLLAIGGLGALMKRRRRRA